MGEAPRFFIAGVDARTWEAYCSWFDRRSVDRPPYVSDGIFVFKWPYTLVAACCIYPCDGPYAVVEHVATNPACSVRDRHDAVVIGARALLDYGAMRKKTMLCFPATKGLSMILRKVGYEMVKVPVMKHGPWSPR